jgi:hypothetical protein
MPMRFAMRWRSAASSWLGAAAVMLALSSSDAHATPSTHRVTYLTMSTVYIDAGSEDGLAPGSRVEVVRAGVVIATLRVSDLSSRRAACAIESSSSPCAVGDAVRFTPATPSAAADTTRAAPVPPEPVIASSAASWPRRAGLRGRVGLRYLAVMDRSGFGGDVSQPSADVRLDGTRVGGSPFDLQVDVRARHTVQTVPDGTELDNGEARVYRLNTTVRSPGDRYRVTLGRQFSSALASISTFDGAQAELTTPRAGLGLFAGTQPAPVDYSFSTDVTEYGAFARWRSAPAAPLRWELVAAGIGSYQESKINREYVALLSRMASPRFSLMYQQEIDVNRGWKRDEGESAVSFTNVFLTARYRVRPGLDLDGGYDNRRDVRLYRDYVSPETEFDDSHRQGFWGGAGATFAQRYRLGAALRSSTGGAAGSASSYTLTASAMHLTPAHVQLRARSTHYENESTVGWMHSISGGISVGARWVLDLFGGTRREESRLSSAVGVRTSWFGADVDVDLGHGMYGNLSGERSDGYDQVYSSVSWRF